MKVCVKPNEGEITFVRKSRPATNEEKFESLMRSCGYGGNKSEISHMIVCPSLLKNPCNKNIFN